ncbi:MAG: hypothetical protein H6667_22945 [Ardenticatenaceae bacterium]|nr:hypothetical protein [Ardenticatenaceae bacterium]MCB9446659.1 hypothetical protein [Ardenticatenaceae bacterium]
MISLELAQALKQAGLVWKASNHHFFAIPDRGMDDHIFVITDMMAHLDLLQGWPVITFHGTAEWALDYIVTTEVVWMPTEGQLRQELENLLKDEGEKELKLRWVDGRCHIQIRYQNETLSFNAATASNAYGETILYILQTYYS